MFNWPSGNQRASLDIICQPTAGIFNSKWFSGPQRTTKKSFVVEFNTYNIIAVGIFNSKWISGPQKTTKKSFDVEFNTYNIIADGIFNSKWLSGPQRITKKSFVV